MFDAMRRSKQALDLEQTEEILRAGTHGVLALAGENGYPYAVPLSYVYADGKIFFHCATDGQKLRAIRRDPRASFCVVGRDEVLPDEFTTLYTSAIAFGRVRELEGGEKRAAIELLARRYSPDKTDGEIDDEIVGAGERLCMLALEIERLSGKQSKELVKR